MRCPNCSSENPDAARFCARCGAAISPVPPNPAAPEQGTQAEPAGGETHNALAGEIWQVFGGFCLINAFTLRRGREGSLRGMLADVPADEKDVVLWLVVALVAAILVAILFVTRVVGLQWRRPGWITGLACVLLALNVYGLWEATFDNYNWVDWISEVAWWVMVAWLFGLAPRIRSAASRTAH